MQDSDEAVGKCSEGLVVRVTGVSVSVIKGASSW